MCHTHILVHHTPPLGGGGGVHCAWSGGYNCFQGVNIPPTRRLHKPLDDEPAVTCAQSILDTLSGRTWRVCWRNGTARNQGTWVDVSRPTYLTGTRPEALAMLSLSQPSKNSSMTDQSFRKCVHKKAALKISTSDGM